MLKICYLPSMCIAPLSLIEVCEISWIKVSIKVEKSSVKLKRKGIAGLWRGSCLFVSRLRQNKTDHDTQARGWWTKNALQFWLIPNNLQQSIAWQYRCTPTFWWCFALCPCFSLLLAHVHSTAFAIKQEDEKLMALSGGTTWVLKEKHFLVSSPVS